MSVFHSQIKIKQGCNLNSIPWPLNLNVFRSTWAGWTWQASGKVGLSQKFQRPGTRVSDRLIPEAQMPFFTEKTKPPGLCITFVISEEETQNPGVLIPQTLFPYGSGSCKVTPKPPLSIAFSFSSHLSSSTWCISCLFSCLTPPPQQVMIFVLFAVVSPLPTPLK